MPVVPKTLLNPEARKRRDEVWKESVRGQEVAAERNQGPPRRLTAEELQLLRWILEHGGEGAQAFLPQLDGMLAVR